MQRASRGMSVRRTFLQRFLQGPVAAPSGACHPWRWLVFEVARSPASPSAPVRRWPFGRSRLAVRRHRRSFTVSMLWARAGILSNHGHAASHLGLAFGVLAEPSRICSPFGSRDPASPGTSSLADVPSPDGPVNVHSRRTNPPSVDGCHTVDLAPSSWFFTTSTVSAVHGFRHVAAGTGSGFARFRSGRSSKPKLLGPGPSSPLAHHPAKFCSSSAAVPHRCGLLPSCRFRSDLVRRRGGRADSRVFLHRRVRVPHRRCRRRVTRSFLGFVSPSRRCLHCRWCPRSPEDPIPLPVCVWVALPFRVTRRTAESVCPEWEL